MKTNTIRFFLILVIASIAGLLPARAYIQRDLLEKQMTEQELAQSLVMNQKWVRFPAYADREGWNRLLGTYKERLIRNGEKYLNYQWKVVPATAYLNYERTGNRSGMEAIMNANNQAIARLLFAELAEGEGRFTDQLVNGVFHTCEMTSWALSAHLANQPDHRSLPDYDYQLIDLMAGDLGNLLSWTYYFMHAAFDKINPEISRRLYHELDKRIMTPYLSTNSFWWMALPYKGQLVNNWNPWCNSNALMTFMLLENDRNRLTAAVYRSMQSVDQFLNYVHADGACEEGPSYWGHAAGKLLDYLDLLGAVTGGKINIYQLPQIRNMGEYISRSFVGNGWVVNFADASAKGGGDPYVIYRYGVATGSEELKQFAACLYRLKPSQPWAGRDAFRTLKAIEIVRNLEKEQPAHHVPDYTWYPETEFYYSRKKNAFLAAKGGYNNESHNHNDVGTFSLWIQNTPIFIDAGVGTYTRQTFSKDRYKIWAMQSNYHNLPLINGQPQLFGAQYKATHVKASKEFFSVDLAAAYGKEAQIKTWVRSYNLTNGKLVINDRFKLGKALQPNILNFLTWGKVTLSDGQIILTKDKVKAVMTYDKKMFKATLETIPLTDPHLSNVWGKEIYRISLKATSLQTSGNYTCTVTY